MGRKYAIGLDFGTESGRALLVALDNGEEIAQAVTPYPHGVIDDVLPSTGKKLEPDWALQDPRDYLHVIETTVPKVLADSGVSGSDVVGIGVDFTACTVLPVTKNHVPLCTLPEFEANPNAWVKLWKHHAAQPEADRINALAVKRNEPFLARYGGKVSSEWLFPKALQVLDEAPEVYAAADRFIEAGDWVNLILTGEEKRNACAAGYKAMWDEGYPSPDFLKELDPRFEHIVAEKLRSDIYAAGTKAGGLIEPWASKLGLPAGTAVSVGSIDAHVGVPGSAVTEPGRMVMIMGTSLCHMVCAKEKKLVPGLAGVVKDGILPGMYGYEAGQAAVGDIFAWFVDNCVPASVVDDATAAGKDVHGFLMDEARKLKPGAAGVLCLDWWNGNRCVLVDADLTGLMIGMTLSTTPAEMYRAILESTAFGTYKIIKACEAGGVPVTDLVACGGMPGKNPLLMQIFSDVTNREIKVAASDQAIALGAAMFGAVAAGSANGGYDTIADAAKKMAKLRDVIYRPNPEAHAVYEKLFEIYERLHDHFGRGMDNAMKELKALRREAYGE
ncbi:MAG: ribulokinase [Candidatus Hydrogenedentota bacterium]